MKLAILCACVILLAATTCPAEVEYDAYGGAKAVQGQAQGRFTLQKVGERWWLMTPDGHGFVSLGIAHILQGIQQPLFKDKYNSSQADFLADVAKNMKAWGFNSAGYGCSNKANLEIAKHLPFMISIEVLFTNHWRATDFHYDDVFDPDWQTKAAAEIAAFCKPAKDQKNLIGYYTTDAPTWTLRKARKGQPDWLGFYRALPAKSPGKAKYVEFLVQRLGAVDAVTKRYKVTADSADALKALTDWPLDAANAEILADDEAFLALIAKEYYGVCHAAIRKNDPDHLYFGDRYFDTDIPEVVLREALPFLDGVAIQPNDKGKFNRELFDKVYTAAKKPILICDWAVNFPTPENPKVMWGAFDTEDLAADAYDAYLKAAFATPYLLGIHRCTYIDLPRPTVLKQGLIRQNGTPYETTVKRYTEIHRQLYERVYSSPVPNADPTR